MKNSYVGLNLHPLDLREKSNETLCTEEEKMLDQTHNASAGSSGNTGDGSGPPTTTGRPLREMGFADILDTTFSLYRSNFRLFIGITVALY